MATTFRPGQAVTVLRGDGKPRPWMFLRVSETSGKLGLDCGEGVFFFEPERVIPWNDDFQAAWLQQLEEEADRAERVASISRARANLAKLARRNTAIESTGKRLRSIIFSSRTPSNGADEYEIQGYWADGHDWTGKREFIPADGTPSLYLFDDEIIEDEDAS